VEQFAIDNATASFDGINSNYTLASFTGSVKATPINTQNTFVFLSGVEQLPVTAYTLSKSVSGIVTISFTGIPPANTTYDIRSITSGEYYATQLTYPVEVYSFDDITPLFDSVQTDFPITYGGVPVDNTVVNSENIFVTLGGAIQLPPQRQFNPVTGVETALPGSYKVENSKIIFSEPPTTGVPCNMRFFGEAEFISCPLPGGLSTEFIRWGPGIVLDLQGQMSILDPGDIP
jgi:hypothetical protein